MTAVGGRHARADDTDRDLGVSVELLHAGFVNLAMATAGISVVRRLTVTNQTDDDLTDVHLGVELHDLEGEVLAAPWGKHLEVLPPRTPVTFETVLVKPDPEATVTVDEQRPASLVVEVVAGDARRRMTEPVRLLAYNQWVAEPKRTELSLELLAAFVLPNHPAVSDLLAEAREELRRATGSPSTQGYQAGPERADEIAGAIYRAAQARRIAYSDPPASWGSGQKVRTPDQVLARSGVGTCLDTTVLLAAAVEQAGLHPLLWVVEGHAFVGYWRDEHHRLTQTVTTEPETAANDVDLDRMRLIETTFLTDSESPTSFADACRNPRHRWLQDRPEKIVGVVDVHQARRNEIHPLPARTRDAAGGITVTVYQPPERSGESAGVAPGLEQASTAPPQRDGRPTAPVRVEQWKNTLLDLSLRNRLINFSSGPSATRLLAADGSLPLVEDLLHDRKSINLRPADDVDAVYGARGLRGATDLPHELLLRRLKQDRELYTELDGGPHATRLRGLARKARTLLEESGSSNLYLAVGTLTWTLERRELRSPLLLLPVTLTIGRGGRSHRLTLDEGGESTPNHCLLEKLRQEHDLELPGLAEPVTDERGVDVAAVLRAVREATAAAGLPFRVHETLDLAVLQFAKFVLWRDLDQHWSRFADSPLVHHLVHTPHDAFEDGVADPDEDLDVLAASCPVAADSSQLDAVARARNGQTFVLEGPPGTGKSQTITNLLSVAMAEGRRVLFVAEKRAALDVVRARLDAIGLGVLSLDLHDKSSKPSAVREQLRRALDHETALDEEGYRVAYDDLRTSARTLARYAQSLHARNAIGKSLYSARDTELARGDGPTLPVDRRLVAEGGASRPIDVTELADAAWRARPRRHHPWGFVRGTPSSVEELRTGTRIADEALAVIAGGPPTLRTLVYAASSVSELNKAVALCRPDHPPLGLLDEVAQPRWERAAAEVRTSIARFMHAPRPVLSAALPTAVGLPLDDLLGDAEQAAASSFFGRKKRQRLVLDRVRPGLVPGAEPELAGIVDLLTQLVRLRDEIRVLRDQVRALPGLGLPDGWNPLLDGEGDRPLAQVTALQQASATLGATDGPFRDALRAHIADPSRGDGRWWAALERLTSGLGIVVDAAGIAPDVDTWRDGASLVDAWGAGADERRGDAGVVRLREWEALCGLVRALAERGSPETAAAVLRGDVAPEELPAAFDRGVARTSIAERRASAELDRFDAGTHERTIARLARASAEVRRHLVEAVPRRIVEERSFVSDSTRGRIGELRREIGRQRGGLSVRALMARYGDLVTQVTPCVLVSPDSLSRFISPDTEPFDLVVFDEASQIRVADAVGALGRARAAVVVGDSKQMPPTMFGGAGANDEELEVEASDEDVIPEDEESILSECVQARVPQTWLSWHYRSQDEALIAFSNRHYYEGRLASFPAPARAGNGLAFRRVDGRFLRSGSRETLRTNPVEARAVVEEIVRRFATVVDDPPSIGVVTFNVQQRDLIDELLRASEVPALLDALEREDDRRLFVKNLENVQGDERDTIFFSVAFSYDDRGRVPSNFGPLNRLGGERRLNVAVTRARREVVVFCSFEPSDLRAENSTSIGLKHLRAYLELAAGGLSSSGDTARKPSARDRHRDDVASALRERGLVVQTDVGLSEFRLDLAVAPPSSPETPTLAILLDGPDWAARRTVGDRDGLPAEVLTRVLGWPDVARVWLPTWMADREGVLDDLQRRVTEPPPPPPEEPAPAAVDVPAASSDLVEEIKPKPVDARPATMASAPPQKAPAQPGLDRPSGARQSSEFQAWEPGLLGGRETLDALPEPAAAARVRRALADAIAAEAPIPLARLARAVARAFDLNRVRQERVDAILALLSPDLRVVDGVVWKPGTDPASWTEFRGSADGMSRPFEDIPLKEIANAMDAVSRESGGMDREELYRETLAAFGGRRLTTGIRERLTEAERRRAA
ncbi:DUF4011 domain-containing protein [Actinomycetospora sp. CA-101289]|uniref:DUF4011 domain-containing protein n=1 Tax=Actinomycetospora sp. CA-101289 TaxID=3239893 RepID=UPI003D999128